MEDQIIITQVESNEVQALRDKSIIDVAISTARAYPRDLQRSINNALITATMDVETASTCTYAVPRGGKSITGPSVHLAKIIIQTWGNFRGESKVVNVASTFVESEAIAWDLETNTAVKVTVRRSIMTNSGRMKEDMIMVTGNAANSIALRNAVFSVIPKAVTDKVYKAAQQKIIGDASEFNKKVKSVLTAFKKGYDQDQEAVLKLVGKTKLDQLTNDDLVTLIGVGQALKDGDTTVDIIFKKQPKTGEERKDDLKAKKAEKTEKDTEAKPEDEIKPDEAQTGLFNPEEMP